MKKCVLDFLQEKGMKKEAPKISPKEKKGTKITSEKFLQAGKIPPPFLFAIFNGGSTNFIGIEQISVFLKRKKKIKLN